MFLRRNRIERQGQGYVFTSVKTHPPFWHPLCLSEMIASRQMRLCVFRAWLRLRAFFPQKAQDTVKREGELNMQTIFVVLFIILYVLANELTYMVAVHQQMGYCQHISAGDLCWTNRIIMAIPCVWYCGWLIGIALFAFSLFGLLHATIGWVLTIPTLNIDDEYRIIRHTDMECGLLIPTDIICLVFTLLSFFMAPFRSAIQVLGSTNMILVIVRQLAKLRSTLQSTEL